MGQMYSIHESISFSFTKHAFNWKFCLSVSLEIKSSNNTIMGNNHAALILLINNDIDVSFLAPGLHIRMWLEVNIQLLRIIKMRVVYQYAID